MFFLLKCPTVMFLSFLVDSLTFYCLHSATALSQSSPIDCDYILIHKSFWLHWLPLDFIKSTCIRSSLSRCASSSNQLRLGIFFVLRSQSRNKLLLLLWLKHLMVFINPLNFMCCYTFTCYLSQFLLQFVFTALHYILRQLHFHHVRMLMELVIKNFNGS